MLCYEAVVRCSVDSRRLIGLDLVERHWHQTWQLSLLNFAEISMAGAVLSDIEPVDRDLLMRLNGFVCCALRIFAHYSLVFEP